MLGASAPFPSMTCTSACSKAETILPLWLGAERVLFLRLQRPVVMTLQTAAEPGHDKRIAQLTVDYSR